MYHNYFFGGFQRDVKVELTIQLKYNIIQPLGISNYFPSSVFLLSCSRSRFEPRLPDLNLMSSIWVYVEVDLDLCMAPGSIQRDGSIIVNLYVDSNNV